MTGVEGEHESRVMTLILVIDKNAVLKKSEKFRFEITLLDCMQMIMFPRRM